MDYEAMWKELKEKITNELEYYKDGRMCSTREQINGILSCETMLNDMRALEEKHN